MKRLFVFVIIAALSMTAQAKYSGGSGNFDDPYLISTPEDMNQIGRNYMDWSAYFKLTTDIDLSFYSPTKFSRIGTDSKHAFTGKFDGDGHTISNFTYNAPTRDYIGIFGSIGPNAAVHNLSIMDANVTGRSYVGGLAGYSQGNINNCYISGSIGGFSNLGGLLGESDGYINYCRSDVAVTGSDNSFNIGGLIGFSKEGGNGCNSTGSVTAGNNSYNVGGFTGYFSGSNGSGYAATLYDCNSASAVTAGVGASCIGGLAGNSESGYINKCFSTGAVSAGQNSQNLGGLAGSTSGHILDSYSTGSVLGADNVLYIGGLVGNAGMYFNLSGAYLDRCYSTGTVSGGYASDYAGGLAGYAAQARITNCYASGNIEADSDVGGLIGMADSSYTAKSYSCGSVSGVIFVGGLVGWNYYSTIEECFWDLETSGQSWSDGGIGRTTLEMKTKATFTNSQWDFFVMWGIDEGQTYPFLKPAAEGPIKISTKQDLLDLSSSSECYDKSFILVNDIDMQGQTLGTALLPSDYFIGTFDGNDHTICNFSIDGADEIGFFSAIGYGGTVRNLGLVNVSVGDFDHTHTDIGILAAANYGSIDNCYVTGSVTGTHNVGGLVGFNAGNGYISNCYSVANIDGNSVENCGGLVGYTDNYLINCGSAGSINCSYDSQMIGGLVGLSYADIINCYSKCSISCGSDSFNIGGLVGHINYGIDDSYFAGTVAIEDNSFNIGGLAGSSDGYISNCYSAGSLTAGEYCYYIGALVGYFNGGYSSSYFLDSSGPDNGIGTSLIDEQMKQKASFIDWWPSDQSVPAAWHICENMSYPKLVWQMSPADLACPDGINFVDYSVFANNWQIEGCTYPDWCGGTDINKDGKVNEFEFLILANHWLEEN